MEDFENEDDLLASLDREFGKKPGSAKAKRPAASYAGAAIIHHWEAHGVELHTCTQQCKCGSFAGGVTGLFLVDIHANGTLRAKRSAEITPDYSKLPRLVKDTTESIDFCPNCFNAGTVTSGMGSEITIPGRRVDDLPTFEGEEDAA